MSGAPQACPVCSRPAAVFWLMDRDAWLFRCGRCGPVRAAESLVADLQARRRRGDRDLPRQLRALAAALPHLPPSVILTAKNWRAQAEEYLEYV
jgi:hypothetical protein